MFTFCARAGGAWEVVSACDCVCGLVWDWLTNFSLTLIPLISLLFCSTLKPADSEKLNAKGMRKLYEVGTFFKN